ncbi:MULTISPECIES: HIT family protein [Pontibacter]|uniref:Histidine triad (HIT) family protein n=1 Tax=Pontibacter lucknowensis TaxID=1077936 RepID=A0A1N6WBK3_9BACT|nr:MULTISPECIES: HIT family protein [Pontibacter]EJF08846.1 histidine triad (HIT) protein [Pontibacter sp. BAB1700]SIQ87553.1 histidine triad (HIT) family protein [Pontibacter lucknowensis]
MEPSIFTKIVKGEIPAYKIAEDDRYLAFLDVFPTTKGHTLVIPKQQIDYLFDLDDELYLGLMAFAKKVAAAVEKAVPCKRIGVAVVGLEVPHAHVHLIPLNKMADMNFANKQKFSKEEFEEVAEKIRKEYEAA